MKSIFKSKKILIAVVVVLLVTVGIITTVTVTGNSEAKTVLKQLSLGEKYLSELDYEKAVVAFNKVIEIEPRNLQAYLGLADAYDGLNQSDNAIEALVTAVSTINEVKEETGEVPEGSESIYIKLAEFYENRGDSEKAYRTLQEGFELIGSSEIKELLAIYFPTIEVSVPSGKYETAQLIALVSNGSRIYYTLNGNEPSTASDTYSEPLEIGAGYTTLKVVAENKFGVLGEIVIYSYTIEVKSDAMVEATSSDSEAIIKGNDGYITFGSYPQSEVTEDTIINEIQKSSFDSNGDTTVNGVKYRKVGSCYYKYEPILWRILSKDGDTLFLLAEYSLDSQPYHIEKDNVSWENSSLRSWLNNDFFTTAFNKTEQKEIETTNLINDDNPYYVNTNGNNTKEKVFLLSIEEATNTEYALADDYNDIEKVIYTAYSEKIGGSLEDENKQADLHAWWMRTPGYYSYYASEDVSYSSPYKYSENFYYDILTVRPSIKIKLDADVLKSKTIVPLKPITLPTQTPIPKEDKVIMWKDSEFERAIRRMINKPTGDIYKSDVEGITSIKILNMYYGAQDYDTIYEYNIESIDDIINFPSLEYFHIEGSIMDISAISNMTNISTLILDSNYITDISAISNLSNLKSLDLGGNNITDISALSKLYNLT